MTGHRKWSCNCTDCQTHRYRVKKQWEIATQGRQQPIRVPLDEARAGIQNWMDRGFSLLLVAKAAGITAETVRDIVIADQETVSRWTVAKLTKLTLPDLYAAADDRTRLPPHGTVRRLQALALMGWGPRSLGLVKSSWRRIMANPTREVTGLTYRQVSAVYNRVGLNRGPNDRIALQAKAKGWHSPLAWDDDTIDDPTTQPWQAADLDPADSTERSRAAFAEDVEHLLDAGLSTSEVASRFGLGMPAVEQRLRRAGRKDLSCRFYTTHERDNSTRPSRARRPRDADLFAAS